LFDRTTSPLLLLPHHLSDPSITPPCLPAMSSSKPLDTLNTNANAKVLQWKSPPPSDNRTKTPLISSPAPWSPPALPTMAPSKENVLLPSAGEDVASPTIADPNAAPSKTAKGETLVDVDDDDFAAAEGGEKAAVIAAGVGTSVKNAATAAAKEVFPDAKKLNNDIMDEQSRTPTAQYNAAQAMTATPKDLCGSLINVQAFLASQVEKNVANDKRFAELMSANAELKSKVGKLEAHREADRKRFAHLLEAQRGGGSDVVGDSPPPAKKAKTTGPGASGPSE
jgi:hypothetical protein